MDQDKGGSAERRLEEAGFVERLPETEEEAEAVEELLATEFASLSLIERDKVMFDVHGIPAAEIEETPELIAKSLEDLEQEIRKLKKKESYENAKYINPEFVNDPAFRLMFLRSDLFNCADAAKRLVHHFEKKEKLFGSGEVLGRYVRLRDLSPDDMRILESGVLQVLPTRDVAGRCIFCAELSRLNKPKDWLHVLRACWYVMMTTMKEDEETQKKGCANIIFNLGKKGEKRDLRSLKEINALAEAVPHRAVAIHYCFEDKRVRPFVSAFRFLMEKSVRTRFRAHCGNHEKVIFELQTYGIPVNDDSPLRGENGIVSNSWHQQWLGVQRRKEEVEQEKSSESTDKTAATLVPLRFDVLFGRGKYTREHTGNLRALHLVDTFHAAYEEADKVKKTEIAEQVVSLVRMGGGRFLKWQNFGWAEVDRKVARDKISHFFRHQRSKAGTSTSQESTPRVKRVSPCPSPGPESEKISRIRGAV